MALGWETIIKSLNWTLIFNVVSFLLLVFLLRRILFRPALRWLEARRAAEEARLSRARALEAQAEELRRRAEAELAQANRLARELVARAEAEAREIVRRAREEAKEEARRILQEAERAAARAQEEAVAELRRAYAELVVLAAAQVLGREVRPEDHHRLLQEFLARLGPGALS
ncbi:MAG: F0F1 ATP synthase subunit B [Candidatus Bipolaricaulaceae bacterium]